MQTLFSVASAKMPMNDNTSASHQARRDACQRIANVYARMCNKRFNVNLPIPMHIDFDLCERDMEGAKSAGVATYFQTIAINDILLREFESHIYNHTIPHEIAHLVVNEKFMHKGAKDVTGHGAEWQQVMRFLGLNPDKYHTLDVTKAVAHYRATKKLKKAKAKASAE